MELRILNYSIKSSLWLLCELSLIKWNMMTFLWILFYCLHQNDVLCTVHYPESAFYFLNICVYGTGSDKFLCIGSISITWYIIYKAKNYFYIQLFKCTEISAGRQKLKITYKTSWYNKFPLLTGYAESSKILYYV